MTQTKERREKNGHRTKHNVEVRSHTKRGSLHTKHVVRREAERRYPDLGIPFAPHWPEVNKDADPGTKRKAASEDLNLDSKQQRGPENLACTKKRKPERLRRVLEGD